MNLKEEFTRIGLDHDWLIGDKESLVHRGRMEMSATFLQQTNYSAMMWLDADIEFEPEHVAKLWNLDVDIAVGVYAMKKAGEDWYAAWKDGKLVTDLDQFDEPTEVDYAGTGFMLIRRSALNKVYQKIREDYERCACILGEAKLFGDNMSADDSRLVREMLSRMSPDYEGPHGRVPALYQTPIHNDGLESEDYHFCRIAREAGLKITMDPSVRLTHWGPYGYGRKTNGAH